MSRQEDETLEDVFNGIIEEVDKKQMHFLIEKAKEKWKKEGIETQKSQDKKIVLDKFDYWLNDECLNEGVKEVLREIKIEIEKELK